MVFHKLQLMPVKRSVQLLGIIRLKENLLILAPLQLHQQIPTVTLPKQLAMLIQPHPN